DEDFPVEGWATDLSISGVGACVEHFLPKDTIVAVELVGETEPKALTARVAWCNKLPSTGRVIKKKHFKWRMGLEFKFNNEEEKKLISKLVERA
ncbi:MAG TPA: PilZ domain-containing protein, partial [Oligoflexia bacterium]|nr:PilZ domain-containing protein [Oligoflexia bacterium]